MTCYSGAEEQVIDYMMRPESVAERDNGNVGLVVSLASELDGAVNECVKGVVLAHSNVGGRIVDSAPLADDNIAGFHDLAAEFLETQAFAL